MERRGVCADNVKGCSGMVGARLCCLFRRSPGFLASVRGVNCERCQRARRIDEENTRADL